MRSTVSGDLRSEMDWDRSTIAIIIGIVAWIVAGIFYFVGRRQGQTRHGWKTLFIILSGLGLLFFIR